MLPTKLESHMKPTHNASTILTMIWIFNFTSKVKVKGLHVCIKLLNL